jgi:hypothetical protein
VARRPWIATTKTWEVDCNACGIFDHKRTKAGAMYAAREHNQEKHGGTARVPGRGWSWCWHEYENRIEDHLERDRTEREECDS